jgi:DNA-binding response OmpR family regulator
VTVPPDARAAHHVLIVDDDSASLRYVGGLLMTHGYGVYAAGSGRLAIEIAERSQPDLILLDIRMPDLDGIDTCRALKTRPQTAGIPVVFVTGRSDEPSMLEGFDAGGADYVVKPFEPAVLLARVGTHVRLGILSRDLERALGERTLELQAANMELRRLAVQVSQSRAPSNASKPPAYCSVK